MAAPSNKAGTPAGGAELDAVLARISGADLYRNNIFRITGVPSDATPARIRRLREEALLANRLDPSADSEAIRVAFETMRDPLARLTHELLWFWRPENGSWPEIGEHDTAVRAHHDVVEAEYAGVIEPDSAEARRLGELWKQSLTAWAYLLSSQDFWNHAKSRVREIDDPRLSTGSVRRLRDRLPGHLVAVTAELALRAAPRGFDAADRLVGVLDDAPFGDDVVDRVLRDVVRPDERLIRAACATARDALRADESKAEAVADKLLEQVSGRVKIIEAVQGPSETLTVALSDEVAIVVNNCALALDRTGSRWSAAMRLLGEAQRFACARGTVDLIADNISAISTSSLTEKMLALCDKGKVDRAAAHRRALLNALPDGAPARKLRDLTRNDRRVAGDVHKVPTCSNFFGCGTEFVGGRDPDDTGRQVTTYYLTILAIPLIPISSYLADPRSTYATSRRFYAKVPLSDAARWWRFFILTFLAGLLISFFTPPWTFSLMITGVFAPALALVGFRHLRLRQWARELVNQ